MWPFSSPRNPYRETIEAKRTCRADAIKLAQPFSTEEHQKYLSATGTVQPALLLTLLFPYFRGLPASQIVENIVSRTWTASEVLEAYIARAAQAHQATNCFTEGTYALPVTTSY